MCATQSSQVQQDCCLLALEGSLLHVAFGGWTKLLVRSTFFAMQSVPTIVLDAWRAVKLVLYKRPFQLSKNPTVKPVLFHKVAVLHVLYIHRRRLVDINCEPQPSPIMDAELRACGVAE